MRAQSLERLDRRALGDGMVLGEARAIRTEHEHLDRVQDAGGELAAVCDLRRRKRRRVDHRLRFERLVRFDPKAERFRSFPYPSDGAEVRQLLGRPGEVWGAESGTDKLVLLTT